MPQLMIFWVLLTVFLLLAPLREQKPPENAIKLIHFQANGLPFIGILGNSFLMHDDKTKTKVELLSVGTPFSLSRGNEEVSFDFEVKKGGDEIRTDYIFVLTVSSEERNRDEVAKLVGGSCYNNINMDYGAPISLYIKIIKKGEHIPVIDKVESKTCRIASGFDMYYRSSLAISKLIHETELSEDKYNVYIKNLLPVHEYNKHKLYLKISTW